jgi:hypothetical protein
MSHAKALICLEEHSDKTTALLKCRLTAKVPRTHSCYFQRSSRAIKYSVFFCIGATGPPCRTTISAALVQITELFRDATSSGRTIKLPWKKEGRKLCGEYEIEIGAEAVSSRAGRATAARVTRMSQSKIQSPLPNHCCPMLFIMETDIRSHCSRLAYKAPTPC